MRTSIILIVLIFTAHFSVVGQTNSNSDGPTRVQNSIKLLVLVDSFKTDINCFIVDPNSIDSIIVIKDSAALIKFGEAGKNGVVLISAKKSAVLLQIEEILKKYNLSPYFNKLKVCINKTVVKEPNLILIEEKEIITVEIITDRNWIDTEDAKSNEKFINIIIKMKN